ncbi:MAG: hypothetical protein IT330_06620 [Anaerolineae bacterium]|nr:hypothetical protein [Anaerolineae bacterium]
MPHDSPMEMRGVNFWAHINNWYEVRSLEDNKRLLEDVALMGFNDFWTTLERGGLRNYFDAKVSDETSRQFWWRIKELAKAAHALGMKVTILDEGNVVFADQCADPELIQYVAETPRPAASLWRPYQLCPSKPRAREVILRNHEESYRDFPVVDALAIWGYDNGGCGCNECHPWPKTFLNLSRELAAQVRKYHPGAAVYLSTWDMMEEEKSLFTQLLSDDRSDTFQGIIEKDWLLVDMEQENPVDSWTVRGLPARYKRIPYIDLCQIGAWGWHAFTANPYPTRFEALLRAMRKAGITHYSSYSEDVHDDINKYLIARIGIDPEKDAHSLIKEYAMKYFQAAVGDDLYEIARLMEDEYTNKFSSPWEQKPVMSKELARRMLTLLKETERRMPAYSVRSWRWQVLAARAELSALINEIGDMDETQSAIESLIMEASTRRAKADQPSDEQRDVLRKAENLISDKRRLVQRVRDVLHSFCDDVLQEPYTRMRYLEALPSYYAWMKMLVEMEEKVATAPRTWYRALREKAQKVRSQPTA